MGDLWAYIWVDPAVPHSRWGLFAVALACSVALTVAISPGRRRAMGMLKMAVAQGSQVMVPLAGLFLVRSGFRHAYEMEGRSFWEAMGLSLVWMTGFVFVGQLAVANVPPTSWLIRDLRQAGKDVWKARLVRLMGRRG